MTEVDSEVDDAEDPPAPKPKVRRRVTTAPPPGSDPNPQPEPKRLPPADNDERMRREKPPHY